ncbi:MAG: ribbon-helix-helix protein, CopG family [Candidatus Riflebacteria bacterium]|nr:ribbon-helix-helix protein, CopG family [Candidatus Riflebacteria bacterium]
MKTVTFATKLPEDLTAILDDLCKRLGLKKNALVEAALREKIEELLDAHDLRQAIEQETRFHSWSSVRTELLRKLPARRRSTKSR